MHFSAVVPDVKGSEPVLARSDTAAIDKDSEGRFPLPVDSEHNATQLKILSFAKPHMRAFHMSTFSFFVSFVSTFAAAPLIPVIRDDLSLTKSDLGNAGIAAVTGTIAMRIIMGAVCDLVRLRRFGNLVMLGFGVHVNI